MVLDALRAVVEGWAFHAPVLVALDDLHVADPATASAVLFLLRQVRHQRVLVAVTSRDAPYLADELGGDLERFERAGSLAVIRLGPLSVEELAGLVRQRLAGEPSPALAQMLEARSGGVPFFAVELLDVLDAAGALTSRDGVLAPTRADPVLPRRASTSVLHRVFQLGADARAVATAAAVLASVHLGDLALLADLAGMDQARTEAAFDVLVRAGVLVADAGAYHFAHAIVRDAVYEDLGPAARRRLHGRIAGALTDGTAVERPRDVVEVAGHVRRAGGGRDPEAAAVLGRAGDTLVGVDPAAAAGWYRDALARIGPDHAGRGGLQLRLSRALDLAHLHGEAIVVARGVLAVARGEDQARARLRAAHSLFAAGRFPEAGALLDEAPAAGASGSARRLLLRAQVHLAEGRPADAAARLLEAAGAGLDTVDDRLLAEALELHLACAAGNFAAAAKLASSLRSWLDEEPGTGGPSPRLALCSADAFDLDPALAVADAEVVGARGPLGAWFQAAAAWALYRMGRWDEALHAAQLAGSATDLAAGSLAAAALLAPRIAIAAERGDVSGATRAAEEAAGVPLPAFRSGVDVAVSLVQRLRGEPRTAEASLRAAAQRERDGGHLGRLAMVLAHQVDVALECDDHVAAHAANDELQACWQSGEGIALTMHCLLARARLGDGDAALAAREHGVRHGLAADAAEALGLLGTCRADADLLGEAYLELGELGATVRQRPVARELRRLGRRVPAAGRRLGGLRPVEADIVDHVASGLSNRQIAATDRSQPQDDRGLPVADLRQDRVPLTRRAGRRIARRPAAGGLSGRKSSGSGRAER